MTKTETFTPAAFRLPSMEKSATGAAIAASAALSMAALAAFANGTNRRIDVLEDRIAAVEADIIALNARVDEVRRDMIQHLNEIVLISLGNRVLTIEEEVRIWTTDRDDRPIISVYGDARATYRELISYLLQRPDFVTDGAYLVLESLAQQLLVSTAAIEVILGKRMTFDTPRAQVLRQILAGGDAAQRALVEAAIRPVEGQLDVQQEENQVFYSQAFGYTEIDGSYVRAASAGAEVTGGHPRAWAEWKASYDAAVAEMNAVVQRRRDEVFAETRAPIKETAAALLDMLAKLGDTPNPPLSELLAGEGT